MAVALAPLGQNRLYGEPQSPSRHSAVPRSSASFSVWRLRSQSRYRRWRLFRVPPAALPSVSRLLCVWMRAAFVEGHPPSVPAHLVVDDAPRRLHVVRLVCVAEVERAANASSCDMVCVSRQGAAGVAVAGVGRGASGYNGAEGEQLASSNFVSRRGGGALLPHQPRLLDEKAALRRLVILLRRAVRDQVVEALPLDVVEIFTELLHVGVGTELRAAPGTATIESMPAPFLERHEQVRGSVSIGEG